MIILLLFAKLNQQILSLPDQPSISFQVVQLSYCFETLLFLYKDVPWWKISHECQNSIYIKKNINKRSRSFFSCQGYSWLLLDVSLFAVTPPRIKHIRKHSMIALDGEALHMTYRHACCSPPKQQSRNAQHTIKSVLKKQANIFNGKLTWLQYIDNDNVFTSLRWCNLLRLCGFTDGWTSILSWPRSMICTYIFHMFSFLGSCNQLHKLL